MATIVSNMAKIKNKEGTNNSSELDQTVALGRVSAKLNQDSLCKAKS